MQLAVVPVGQVAQVANRGRAVPNGDVADRQGSGLDAVEPVLVVVLAGVKVDVARGEGRGSDLGRVCLDLVASRDGAMVRGR